MGIHLKRRKMLGKAGVVALLAAAALVLSGCWATVYNFSDGTRNITLTKDFSGRLISSCTAQEGTGAARAFCVLDRINGVCRAIPIKGVTETDCVLLASYGDWEELDRAIQDVIGPGSHYDCLAYNETKDGHNAWGAVGGIGFFGCQ
ncbi:MAG: hypothetical protein AABM43_10045 [Actinomycetota bacterium]